MDWFPGKDHVSVHPLIAAVPRFVMVTLAPNPEPQSVGTPYATEQVVPVGAVGVRVTVETRVFVWVGVLVTTFVGGRVIVDVNVADGGGAGNCVLVAWMPPAGSRPQLNIPFR